MDRKVVARPITSSLLALIMIIGSVVASDAQDSRSRHGSRQRADQPLTVPDNTVIPVRLNVSLNSRTSRVGDRFTATVSEPVTMNGRVLIPAGAEIEGRVTQVVKARRMGKSGAIAVEFDDLVFPNGSRVPIVGNLTSDDPDTRRRMDDENRVSGGDGGKSAVFVGSSGAMGAVLGGIMGGARGAIVGGVLGAGAGVASILLSKGEEADVPSGTPFGIQLRQPIAIRDEYIDDQPAVVARDNDPRDRDPRDRDPVDNRADNQPAYSTIPDSRQPDDRRPEPSRPEPARPVEPDPEPDRDNAQPEPVENERPAENTNAEPLPLSSPEMIRRAQISLKEQGYYEGETDGSINPRTSAALKVYQRENNLPETGDLDPATAKGLGILGSTGPANRAPSSSARPAASRPAPRPASSDVVLATVLSATANRTADGGIRVVIDTQANTGGWRWYGDQVVNGDTLEVYARAVRPTGIVTQALTRGRIELIARERVEYVRRVVIHSAGGDQVVPLGGQSQPSPAPVTRPVSNAGLQRQAEELLAEYQRISGLRLTGTGVEVDRGAKNGDAEIELLFALDSFANAAQLYTRMSSSMQGPQALRSATLAMAKQARRTDRVISTSTSPLADSIAGRWDVIRQEVLRLMQAHNITVAQIEN